MKQRDDAILLIDEPALHLHPNKIRSLARKLISFSKSQVIIITHSPYFVNTEVFGSDKSLICVSRIEQKTCVKSAIDGFTLSIKSYLFKPEVFFCKCNLLVEGASDAASISAISEYFDKIFVRFDVILVDLGGKDNLSSYIPLFQMYELSHVAMVDKDYLCEKRNQTSDFIVLAGRLEDELKLLDPELEVQDSRISGECKKSNSSIRADSAYKIVTAKMKTSDGRNLIRSTDLGKVFDSVLSKLGLDPETVWKI